MSRKRKSTTDSTEVIQQAEATDVDKKRPNRRRLLGLVVLLFLASVALYKVLDMWANAPVSGSVNLALAGNSAAKPEYQTIKTDYFSARLPQNWYIKQNDSAKGRVQILAFAASGNDGGQVGIVSDALPPEGLSAVSDYHLRNTSPADYAVMDSAALKLPLAATVFRTLTGPPQYSLFAVHDGRFVSVAISGASSSAESISLLRAIMTGWIWL
jgi:hypothetical protein